MGVIVTLATDGTRFFSIINRNHVSYNVGIFVWLLLNTDTDSKVCRFEKSLYDLIKGLRNHKGAEEEYIQNSLRECKAEIKSQDMGIVLPDRMASGRMACGPCAGSVLLNLHR